MKGEIETRLERGIEATRVGEAKRARDIFIHIIELDQYNEQAWLWLSRVVETAADKRVCLENVLFINPDNAHAAAGLQRLRQQLTDYLTSTPTLPSLAVSQAKDTWEEGEEEDEWEWDAAATAASPMPARQVCPRCGYRNPGWVYVCDRCGADLQPVNLREALSSGSRPRGRSLLTLLEAWGGAFTFNRLFAFQPEIELAAWGRSLAALVIAALFTSTWRATMAIAPRLTSGAVGGWKQIVTTALRCAAETLPPVLLLMLTCLPILLLTWVGARLAGGKQSFKTHAHLTTVAFSAWIILVALLSPLLTFAPQTFPLSLG